MTQRASDSRTATAFYSIANKPHARQTSKTRARRTTKEKHAYIIPFLLRESTRQKGTKQGWRSRWQGRRCSSAAGNQPQNPNLVEVLSVQEVLEGSDYHANGWCFPCPRCKSSSFCTIIDPFFSGIRMSTVECGHREGWRQVALVWHIVAQLLALQKGQGLPCLTGSGIKNRQRTRLHYTHFLQNTRRTRYLQLVVLEIERATGDMASRKRMQTIDRIRGIVPSG